MNRVGSVTLVDPKSGVRFLLPGKQTRSSTALRRRRRMTPPTPMTRAEYSMTQPGDRMRIRPAHARAPLPLTEPRRQARAAAGSRRAADPRLATDPGAGGAVSGARRGRHAAVPAGRARHRRAGRRRRCGAGRDPGVRRGLGEPAPSEPARHHRPAGRAGTDRRLGHRRSDDRGVPADHHDASVTCSRSAACSARTRPCGPSRG